MTITKKRKWLEKNTQAGNTSYVKEGVTKSEIYHYGEFTGYYLRSHHEYNKNGDSVPEDFNNMSDEKVWEIYVACQP